MIDRNENTYRVTAPMTLANARALLKTGQSLLGAEPDAGNLQLDLTSVQELDSSALSVLLGLQRAATARGIALRIAHPPANLLSLARLYGVADALLLA